MFVPFAMSIPNEFIAAKKEFTGRYLTVRPARPEGFRLFAAAPTPQPKINLVGVGFGEKITAGEPTGIPAVKLFVRQKIPANFLTPATLLPRTAKGLPTDVEEIGLVVLHAKKAMRIHRQAAVAPTAAQLNPRKRLRPAQPGCSVGFAFLPPDDGSVMAGTFGALVKDTKGTLYILSNNHVLADEGRLKAGAPIYQPGLLDGGKTNADQIAELTRYVPLDPAGGNQADAAIARVLDPSDVSNAVLFIGPPAGKKAAQIDQIVHKFGRTTDYTVGRVASVNTDVTIPYRDGDMIFTEQIIIRSLTQQPFSKPGDSGSLILERGENRAIGLLFAGSDTHTIANHIDDVLRALKVDL